jgi:hypothetical protein
MPTSTATATTLPSHRRRREAVNGNRVEEDGGRGCSMNEGYRLARTGLEISAFQLSTSRSVPDNVESLRVGSAGRGRAKLSLGNSTSYRNQKSTGATPSILFNPDREGICKHGAASFA